MQIQGCIMTQGHTKTEEHAKIQGCIKNQKRKKLSNAQKKGMHKHLNTKAHWMPDTETQRSMSTLRQEGTDARLQRLRICKSSNVFKDKDAYALKHTDQGHTETGTYK